MKTSKLLATVFATVAIAGVAQFSTTNAAVACLVSKKSTPSHFSSSGPSNSSGSFFSKIFPFKSDNAGIWTAAGTAGLFGLGALYLTLGDSEKTAAGAAVDATGDGNEHSEAPPLVAS